MTGENVVCSPAACCFFIKVLDMKELIAALQTFCLPAQPCA